MPEQPFYKLCEYCANYLQTIASKGKRVCTRFPQHIDREPDDTCGEWLCTRCWIPWDMVTPNDEEMTRIHIIDHSKCPEINMEPKEILNMEED